MHEMRATSAHDDKDLVVEWHVVPRHGAVALCGRDLPCASSAPPEEQHEHAHERWCRPCLAAFAQVVTPVAS